MADLPFSYLDDDEFQQILFQLKNGPVRFDENRLSTLIFIPLRYDFNNAVGLCSDLDANTNFYDKVSQSCDYFTEQTLNSSFDKKSLKNFFAISFESEKYSTKLF